MSHTKLGQRSTSMGVSLLDASRAGSETPAIPSSTGTAEPIVNKLREMNLLYDAARIGSYDEIHTLDDYQRSPTSYNLLSCLSYVPGLLLCAPCYTGGRIVYQGEIQLANNAGEFVAFGQGYHFWTNPFMRSIGNPRALHHTDVNSGTWQMVTVHPATLMMVETSQGDRFFLSSGIHQWNSANLNLMRNADGSPLVFQLESSAFKAPPYTIINVGDNEAAVVRDSTSNKITALTEGIHVLTSQSSVYMHMLQLTDQARSLCDLNTSNSRISTTTADNILLEFEVNYTYRIREPQLAAQHLGNMDTIQAYVNRELMKEVARYIRTQYMGNISPSDTRVEGVTGSCEAKDTSPSAPPAESRAAPSQPNELPTAHAIRLTDAWCEEINAKMTTVGIEIGQPGLFNLQIKDRDAREAMREVAVRQAQANASLLSAEASAQAKTIEAGGNAQATTIGARADAAAIREIASAQKDAVEQCSDPVAQQLLLTEAAGKFVSGDQTKWVVPDLAGMMQFFGRGSTSSTAVAGIQGSSLS